MENTQDLLCGRMSTEPSPQTKEKTSGQSSKPSARSMKPYLFLDLRSGSQQERSWGIITPSPGEDLTRNTGECPSEENVSTLSQILMDTVPEKYSLSPRACLGILRRASARGKELPPPLESSLRAQSVKLYENHGKDGRYTGPIEVAQGITAYNGTGGNNLPFVVRMREGCDGGGKGPLVQEDKTGTLGTSNDQYLFTPKAYGICSKESNAMKSDNPHSGFYEASTARTIDTSCQSPNKGQGGMAVVAYGIDRAAFNQGKNALFDITIEEEMNSSLVAKGPSAVCYSTSHNDMHTRASDNCASALVATDAKDPPTVCEEPYYIVRRLTPTECGRLQGFPDWWCEGLEQFEPDQKELAFWDEVFTTYGKPKTEKQLRKWLANPHTDSAEYKMWGNGCALPNVYYVLFGIVNSGQNTL